MYKLKRCGQYLMSPHKWSDGDELWLWSKEEKDAHTFKDRLEAKTKLRSLIRTDEWQKTCMIGTSFHKVKEDALA